MLNKKAKVWIFSIKVWWYIYFVLQVLLIGLIIGTLSVPQWVHTSSDFTIIKDRCYANSTTNFSKFNGNSFQGSIAKCEKGGCLDYPSEAVDWCEIYDKINKGNISITCDVYSASSMCKLFTGLSWASAMYIVFEIITMIAIISWVVAIICTSQCVCCFCCVYFCSVFTFIAHFIAIIGWIGISGSTYNSTCDTFPSNGSMPPLCTNEGPVFGLYILMFLILLVVSFIIVAYRAKKNGLGLINEDNIVNNGELDQSSAVVNEPPKEFYGYSPSLVSGQALPVHILEPGPAIYFPEENVPIYKNPETPNIIDSSTYQNEFNNPGVSDINNISEKNLNEKLDDID